MVKDRYLAAVVTHLTTELHESSAGHRCRCGGCRHRIAVAARRAGIRPERLVGALPPERPRKEEKPQRRTPARLMVQVSGAMTVTRDGRRRQGVDAVRSLLAVD